jgi:hypothetical protein
MIARSSLIDAIPLAARHRLWPLRDRMVIARTRCSLVRLRSGQHLSRI